MSARDIWLTATPHERAEVGPNAFAICGAAIQELSNRLVAIGFPLTEPVAPCSDLAASVARLEAVGPRVPTALRSLWSQIGSLSLVDQSEYRHVQFWLEQGVQFERTSTDAGVTVTDGVKVEAPSNLEWLEYMVDELAIQTSEGWPEGYELSADGYHKDNISGGVPYLLVARDDPWLPRLTEFRWCGPSRPVSAPPGHAPDLLSYLRSALLEAAGFPGLLGGPAFEPIRQHLVEELPTF